MLKKKNPYNIFLSWPRRLWQRYFHKYLVLNHFPEYHFQKPCGFLKKMWQTERAAWSTALSHLFQYFYLPGTG